MGVGRIATHSQRAQWRTGRLPGFFPNVYIERGSYEIFKKTYTFPEGTILFKELRFHRGYVVVVEFEAMFQFRLVWMGDCFVTGRSACPLLDCLALLVEAMRAGCANYWELVYA